MARMKVSHENLRIEVDPDEAEAYALGAIAVLQKNYGQKVHFLRETQRAYPRVFQAAKSGGDVTIFESGRWPEHFRKAARVVETEGELVVVPPALAARSVKLSEGYRSRSNRRLHAISAGTKGRIHERGAVA